MSQRRSRGRPVTLTRQTARQIIETVRAGNYVDVACAQAEVSRSTLYRWLWRAKAEEQRVAQGGQPNEREQRFVRFRDAFEQSRAEAEVTAALVLRQATLIRKVLPDGTELTCPQPDGRLALTYLARAFPKQWGHRATGEDDLLGEWQNPDTGGCPMRRAETSWSGWPRTGPSRYASRAAPTNDLVRDSRRAHDAWQPAWLRYRIVPIRTSMKTIRCLAIQAARRRALIHRLSRTKS